MSLSELIVFIGPSRELENDIGGDESVPRPSAQTGCLPFLPRGTNAQGVAFKRKYWCVFGTGTIAVTRFPLVISVGVS